VTGTRDRGPWFHGAVMPGPPSPSLRPWAGDLAAGSVVLLLGLWEAVTAQLLASSRPGLALTALVVAMAVGTCRWRPELALGLMAALGLWQAGTGSDLMFVELALAVVPFACARWGHPVTAALGLLATPAGVLLATVYVHTYGLAMLSQGGFGGLLRATYFSTRGFGRTAVALALLGAAILCLPWLAGLALRFWAGAQASRASQVAAEVATARAVVDREQAEEIARLREEQAQLARDVHDVVGHSLTVILSQADAAEFSQDPDALRETLARISSSARTSLDDVRHVLATTQPPAGARTAALESLVDGIRASGHAVETREHGEPRPLPPELETVAYRVLQEMLTNAIKHGTRRTPIVVERHWEGELRLEVRNSVDPMGQVGLDETQPISAQDGLDGHGAHDGQGVDGMRRRLESVGGRLDVRRRDERDSSTWTATAWVPLRRAG
jgi:signal transduction histidine kinase